jgi:hypothetical protein
MYTYPASYTTLHYMMFSIHMDFWGMIAFLGLLAQGMTNALDIKVIEQGSQWPVLIFPLVGI